jgi:hypothetical protein
VEKEVFRLVFKELIQLLVVALKMVYSGGLDHEKQNSCSLSELGKTIGLYFIKKMIIHVRLYTHYGDAVRVLQGINTFCLVGNAHTNTKNFIRVRLEKTEMVFSV